MQQYVMCVDKKWSVFVFLYFVKLLKNSAQYFSPVIFVLNVLNVITFKVCCLCLYWHMMYDFIYIYIYNQYYIVYIKEASLTCNKIQHGPSVAEHVSPAKWKMLRWS